jgi:hypothetical protein
MSKNNKVNKDRYTQRGRLTPDDMARQRVNQGEVTGYAKVKEDVRGQARQPSGGAGAKAPRTRREE